MTPESLWIRRGLGVLMAGDAAVLGLRCGLRWDSSLLNSGLTGPLASLPVVTLLALVGVIAGGLFASSGRGRPLTAIAALLATGVLVEVDGALFGDYSRNFFHPGAMVLAWLVTELLTGLAGLKDPRLRAKLAAHAAVCVLGATYINAGLSKLLAAGGGWVNPAVLRLTVMMERQPGVDSHFDPLRDLLIASPDLAAELAVATVVLELGGALLWFGPRLRALGSAGLLSLHIGMAVMLEIVFWEPVLLLLWCGFPWWRLGRSSDQQRPIVSVQPRRVLGLAVGILVLAIGIAASPVRPSQDGGLRSAGDVQRDLLGSWGPLKSGQVMEGGWTVETLERFPHRIEIALYRGGDERVAFVLGDIESDVMPGPVALWPLRLAYDRPTVPYGEFKAAFEAIAVRIQGAAESRPLGDAFTRWSEGSDD